MTKSTNSQTTKSTNLRTTKMYELTNGKKYKLTNYVPKYMVLWAILQAQKKINKERF